MAARRRAQREAGRAPLREVPRRPTSDRGRDRRALRRPGRGARGVVGQRRRLDVREARAAAAVDDGAGRRRRTACVQPLPEARGRLAGRRMERFDRGGLLIRAGGLTLAAGTVGVGPALARWSGLPLRELARTLDGTVVARGAAGYAQARLLVSTRFDAVHPKAVVFCESVADVEKTVRWARRHHVHVVARSAGHSYGGYSTTSGVVIDVSRISGVHLEAGGRIATVGAGARLIDVYNSLWLHGLTIPAGSCPTVGIAGLTLGGGVGFSARKLGLTCDRLRAARVVLASGAAVHCSPSRHRDLFWALRGGGGGNFGIVTHLGFRPA